MKSTVVRSLKEMGKGQLSQESPSKRQKMTFSSIPPLSRHPRSASPSVPSHILRFQNVLQKSRYELLQGTRYSCGRQILWDVFAHANFYSDIRNYIEKMSWMRLANLSEKCYSPMLVNEFYSGLLIHANEYENPTRFDSDVLYTFIDGQQWIIIEFDFGKLLGCEFYGELFEVPKHYQTDNVWDTLAREPGCKKVASNLKSLPLRFLHHFIVSTIQCRTGSFSKLTTDDIWCLRWLQQGLRLTLLDLS